MQPTTQTPGQSSNGVPVAEHATNGVNGTGSHHELLTALQAMRVGDFSVRMSGDRLGIEGKIADFQARLEQIDFALQPENIESSTAGYGSTRPEQAREARKKQLEGEKARVQAQLRLAESSKTRLENAVSSADSEVDLLRAKLNQRREQMDAQPVTTDTPKPRKP